MGDSGIERLVHKWLELLNHKLDIDVLVTIELLHRVSMV